jgi:hypothetical protein
VGIIYWLHGFSSREFVRAGHPHNVNRAGAAAEVIVAEVSPVIEKQAFEAASRRQHMTEGELRQEEAWEREAEIERNRRRPGGGRFIIADLARYEEAECPGAIGHFLVYSVTSSIGEG